MAKTKVIDVLEERNKADQQQLIDNRRLRFTELLGEDCKFIDALIINLSISPWDVQELLEKGCSKELIKEILL